MYEYLRGKLIEASGLCPTDAPNEMSKRHRNESLAKSATTSYAIIETGGIGYKILLPIHLLDKLQIGKEALFFTFLVIKEDAHQLYGFLDRRERELFETLIGISGIGPKTALSIIGHLPLPLFAKAVQTNHIATFTQVPGIGKKTAERLLLELRGKSFFEKENASLFETNVEPKKLLDALNALTNLGYNQAIARSAIDKALQELPAEYDLPTLISQALKSR